MGVITGEPGIGKTALVDTFVAHVAATEDVWIGRGQCLDHYGAGEAYLPILEALGRLGRGPGGERLVALLRQYAPSWLVQMPGLLPPAAWEMLRHSAGGATQPRMLRELTEALDVLTAERPLVLVLEDLHWSDVSTLAWLTYVARRPDPARLLLLGTYRPVDAMVRAHPIRTVMTELAQHQQGAELPLDYLSAGDVAAYCGQRWRGQWLPAEVAPVLYQRTRGHPLFLVTIVDEMRNRGLRREEAPEGTCPRSSREQGCRAGEPAPDARAAAAPCPSARPARAGSGEYCGKNLLGSRDCGSQSTSLQKPSKPDWSDLTHYGQFIRSCGLGGMAGPDGGSGL